MRVRKRTMRMFIPWPHKLRKFVRLMHVVEQSRMNIYRYWREDRSISK